MIKKIYSLFCNSRRSAIFNTVTKLKTKKNTVSKLKFSYTKRSIYRVSHPSCHPPKQQSPRHGAKEKTESKNSPHVWDSVFLGGGKKDDTPCKVLILRRKNANIKGVAFRYHLAFIQHPIAAKSGKENPVSYQNEKN